MANPAGVPKNCTDNEIWDAPFSFKLGASGAVAAKSLPRDIRDIVKTANPGEYQILLRERWGDAKSVVSPGGVVGFNAQGITATVNRGQVTADNSNVASPSVTFVTLTESGGVQAPANLALDVVVFGTLSLRNSSVK